MHAEIAPCNGSRAIHEHFSAGDVEVRLAALCFCDGSDQCPRDPEIERQIGRHAPIVLDIRTEQLPAAAGGCSDEGLVMQDAPKLSELSQKYVRRRVASAAHVDEEAILEGIGLHDHL